MENTKSRGLNSNQLKMIAIIAMTLDHVMFVLYPNYSTAWWIVGCHVLGRLAAPIMWFFIAEGYFYTHNVKRYIGRLLVFAVISHFAYNFAFGIPFIPFQKSILDQTSVIWSLAWGLVALVVSYSSKLSNWTKYALITIICAITFPANWSCIAVLAIMAIAFNRNNFKKQMTGMICWATVYAVVYFLFINRVYGMIQLFVALSIPLLKAYNGQRGKWKWMKWFFYIYYPLHLTVCGMIRVTLYGI